jgi:hypothetical protein
MFPIRHTLKSTGDQQAIWGVPGLFYYTLPTTAGCIAPNATESDKYIYIKKKMNKSIKGS